MANRHMDLVEKARAAGWRVKKRGGTHYMLYPPDLRFTPVLLSTSQDTDVALANTRARLRARGLEC